MTVRLRPEAANDLRAAMEWYEEREAGLASAFLEQADLAFYRAASHPERYPKAHGHLRRILMQRFPYAIYFSQDAEGGTIIFAVLHHRQNSGRLDTRG